VAYNTGRATVGSLRDDMEKKIKDINYILVAVVIVLVVAVVSMVITVQGIVITYQKDDSSSYQDYRNELRSQNDKIDALTNELKINNGIQQSTTK